MGKEGRGHAAKQDELDELGFRAPGGGAASHHGSSDVGGQPASGPAPCCIMCMGWMP